MTAALLTYRVIDSAVYSERKPLATSDFVDRLEVVVSDMSHSVTSGQSGDEARQLSEVSSLRLGVLLFRLQLRQGPSEFRFNRRVELIEVRHDRLTRLAGVLVAYERVACDAVQQVVQTLGELPRATSGG